jgi:hypothetical protein
MMIQLKFGHYKFKLNYLFKLIKNNDFIVEVRVKSFF